MPVGNERVKGTFFYFIAWIISEIEKAHFFVDLELTGFVAKAPFRDENAFFTKSTGDSFKVVL